MANTISIKRPDETVKVIDAIHDCWFDIDNINYNQNFAELTIKFYKEIYDKRSLRKLKFFLKKSQIPIVECFLRIHHVRDYELKDEEQVGRYDFNSLEYDNENKILRILTGIPLGLQISVDEFEISVEITDNIISQKESFTII